MSAGRWPVVATLTPADPRVVTSSAAALAANAAPELTENDFRRVAELTKQVAGINLQRGKEGLVRARLTRRLRALGLASFDDYLALVAREPSRVELKEMVDALTTNKTSFFREPQHFDYLRRTLLPALAAAKVGPRIWSAGCSSGEEPVTLAIVLQECLPEQLLRRSRILATDISARVLDRARDASYPAEQLAELPRDVVRRNFVPAPGGATWQVVEPLRRMIHFARLNLMGDWPMQGPFDAVFCRNVMIYFDKPTQGRLVARFWDMLAPGGHLFVGHSESLTGLDHRFRYVQPAVYVKDEA